MTKKRKNSPRKKTKSVPEQLPEHSLGQDKERTKMTRRQFLMRVAIGGALGAVGGAYLLKKKEGNKDSKPSESHSSELTTGNIKVKLQGSPEDQETLHKALQKTMLLLEELGIPLKEYSPQQEITIISDPSLKERGSVTSAKCSLNKLDAHQKNFIRNSTPPQEEGQIRVNITRAGNHLPVVIAHELFHVMSGNNLCHQFWQEGIAEALELMISNNHPEYPPQDTNIYHLIDTHALDQQPWNTFSGLDYFHYDEVESPANYNMKLIRRHIGARLWAPFLGAHPEFLGNLIKKVQGISSRGEILITENGLLEIAEEIHPGFSDFYCKQACTQKPSPGSSLVKAVRYGDSALILHGYWHQINVILEPSNKIIPTIFFKPYSEYKLRVQTENGFIEEKTLPFPRTLLNINLPPGCTKAEIFHPEERRWIEIQ